MKKTLLIFIFLGWLLPEAIAQRQVTGRVTDAESGEVLPGVNILIKGTNNGTVTDINGRYRLEIPSEEAVLKFSFIGYLNEQIQVGEKSVLDVILVPNLTTLDEVVVTGYGFLEASD